MKKVPLSNNGQSEWLKVDWGTYESIIASTDFNNLPKDKTKNATVTGRYSSHNEAQADFVKKDYKRADESMYQYFVRVYGQKNGDNKYNEWLVKQHNRELAPNIKTWWQNVAPKNIKYRVENPPFLKSSIKPKIYSDEFKENERNGYFFDRDPYNANIPQYDVLYNRKGEITGLKIHGRKISLSSLSKRELERIEESASLGKTRIEHKIKREAFSHIQTVTRDDSDQNDSWRRRLQVFSRLQGAQWGSRNKIGWTRAYRQNYTKNLLREWQTDPKGAEAKWKKLLGDQYDSMKTPYEKARAQYNIEGGFVRGNNYYAMMAFDDLSKVGKRSIAKEWIAYQRSTRSHKVHPKEISDRDADNELRKGNKVIQRNINIEKQDIRFQLNHVTDIFDQRDIALINTVAQHPVQRARNLNKIDYSQYYSGNAPYKQFFKEAPKGFHVPKAISRRAITREEFGMARDLFISERSKQLVKEFTGEAKVTRAEASITLFEDKIKDLEKQREARLEGLRLTIKSRRGDVNKISHLVEDDDTLKTIARKLTLAQKDLDEARATVEELRARVRPERSGDYKRAKFAATDDWSRELRISKAHGGSLATLPNAGNGPSVKLSTTGTKDYSRPIVVYDVETGPQEEILSVSAAKFVIDKKTNKLVKVDTFNRFYYPIITDRSAWNNEAVRVNGLTPDVIRAYRKHDHAKYSKRYDAGEMNALLKYIGQGSVLVGQNSHDFDNMKAFHGHLPGIDTVDTMDVARDFRGTNIGDIDEKEWRVKNDLESLVRWADWVRTGRHGSDGGKGRTMKELGFSHHLSEHDIVATAFVFETMVGMKNEAGNALRFVLNNPGYNFGPYDSMVKSLIYKGAYKQKPEPGSYIDRRFYNMKTSDNDISEPKTILPEMDMTEEDTQTFDVNAQGNRTTDSFQETKQSEKALDKIGTSIGIGDTTSEKVAEAFSKDYHEARFVEALETFSNIANDLLGSVQAARGGSSLGLGEISATGFAKKIQNLHGTGMFSDADLALFKDINSSVISPNYVLSEATKGVTDAIALSKKQMKNSTYFDALIDNPEDAFVGEFHNEWAQRIAERGQHFGSIYGIGDREAQQNRYNELMSYFDVYNKMKETDKEMADRAAWHKYERESTNGWADIPSSRGSLRERFDRKYFMNPDFRNRIDAERDERAQRKIEQQNYYDSILNMSPAVEKRRAEEQAILSLGSKFSGPSPYRDSDTEAQRSLNIWEAQENDKKIQRIFAEQAKKRTEQQNYYDSILNMSPAVEKRRAEEYRNTIGSFAEGASYSEMSQAAAYIKKFNESENNIPISGKAYASSVWKEFEQGSKAMKELAESADNVSDKFGTLTSAIAEYTPGKSRFYDPRITTQAAEKGYMGAFGAADFLPRGFQKNLLRLGDAGFRQLNIKQSAFGTWLDIAHESGLGMQDTMKKVGGFAGEKIGGAVGESAGGPLGKDVGKKKGRESGEAIGNAVGWGINFTSQVRGRLQKRKIENQFAEMQSTFDLMSMAKDYMVAPFKILGAAAKTLTSVFKNLSVSVVNFMGSSLQDMGKMGTPLTTMTGVGYSQYQGLGALDSLFGFSKGTLNSSFENTAQQAQLLYSTGQFNQERLIASARLGVFGQTYGRNASFEGIVNGLMSRPVTEERMALAGQIDSSLPVIMETMKALGISTWEQYKNPALQGIGWHAINDDERLRMRKSYYEYSAIQENIGNTKKRAGQWLWSKGGKDIMNGVNEALDIIVSGGDWKQAWLKLKTPIIKVWDQIKDFFKVSFSDTDTLWQKIKKFGKAVWDKIADSLGIESSGKNPIDVLKGAFETFIESIGPTMVKGILMIEELWTAAFQSIITSAAPILDDFFDMMSRIKIDPLALIDIHGHGIPGHDQAVKIISKEEKYEKMMGQKNNRLTSHNNYNGSERKMSPYFEFYNGPNDSFLDNRTDKIYENPLEETEFVFGIQAKDITELNKAFKDQVKIDMQSASDGVATVFMTPEQYVKSSFYKTFVDTKAVMDQYMENGPNVNQQNVLKNGYTLSDGKGHTVSMPYIEGETLNEAWERFEGLKYNQTMIDEVSGRTHLFSEQIAPALITATNYINDSVIPDLLECIIKILNDKFGLDLDIKITTDEKGNRQVSYKGKKKDGSSVPSTVVTEENPGTGWDLNFGNTTG